MAIPIRLRQLVVAWIVVVACGGTANLAHAQFFGGDQDLSSERIFVRAWHRLTPAELAPIRADDDPETRRTIERMSRRISANVKDMPLSQFADKIASETAMQIIFDHRALEEASVTEEQPITLNVDQVPLRQALSLALEPLDLKIEVMGKIALLTTQEKAKTLSFTVVYPVFDLVVYPRNIEKRVDRKITTGVAADFDTLMTTLQETIAPDSWEEAGGPGRITPFPASCALVISTTREVHEQVEQTLTALRRARAIQQVESYSITSDNAASKEIVTLASRSLAAPRTSGPKRIHRQPQVNHWQIPRTTD